MSCSCCASKFCKERCAVCCTDRHPVQLMCLWITLVVAGVVVLSMAFLLGQEPPFGVSINSTCYDQVGVCPSTVVVYLTNWDTVNIVSYALLAALCLLGNQTRLCQAFSISTILPIWSQLAIWAIPCIMLEFLYNPDRSGAAGVLGIVFPLSSAFTALGLGRIAASGILRNATTFRLTLWLVLFGAFGLIEVLDVAYFLRGVVSIGRTLAGFSGTLTGSSMFAVVLIAVNALAQIRYAAGCVQWVVWLCWHALFFAPPRPGVSQF